MATSKAQALQKIADEDAKAVEKMRADIEKALEKYDGTTHINIVPTGSRKAWKAIADEYRAVGWVVNYGSEQFDGCWLTLE